jgi:flagellar assembly protein FliH
MSSKLHRGGLPIDPIAWRRASSLEPPQEIVGTYAPISTATGAGQSFHQGFQEGQAAGREEMVAQIDAMNGRLARAIEEISGVRQRFRHEAEEDVVALAIAMARRILHRELTVAPEALLGLVKAALEKIDLREVHRIRVCGEDAAIVQQYLEKMGLPRRVEVVPDPGLGRGAAVLESTRGVLDASVETQLAEIERGFADLVRRA